ncbi:phage terminase small subunit [Clostridioides difficile]|uniref:phage terminase small subunit n=1 Tax=Clostridioides difficile TaxID=1496 RepID=UPI00374F1D7B
MARAPNKKEKEAKKLYLKGLKLVEIAKKLDIPDGTVRRWKKTYNWDSERSENNNERSAKRGGQPNNKNAIGSGAPLRNKNHLKHGLYESIYWDTLSKEEKEMLQEMEFDREEQLLKEQLMLFTVRERRLLKSIENYKNKPKGLVLESGTIRNLVIQGNLVKDNEQKQTETISRTISVFEVIQKLEAEITKIQARKTKCIELLGKINNQENKEDKLDKYFDKLESVIKND